MITLTPHRKQFDQDFDYANNGAQWPCQTKDMTS